MDVPIAEYAPDQPPYESGVSRNVLNVAPETVKSYVPQRSLQAVTAALTARCQGAASMRGSDGTIRTFAGDATKLYTQLNATWTDASRLVGGAYTITDERFWEFARFGDIAIAVNGNDVAQKYAISTDTDFSALGGTPPVGKHIAVWGDHVVMGNLSTANYRLQWSGTNDAESWTVGAENSDEQDFPEGGEIIGLTGGRLQLVLMENAIHRATFVGPGDIFQFKQISIERGCAASGSIAQYQGLVFFLSRDGFMLASDDGIKPIGEQRVDNTFWADVNRDYLFRITATCDPVHKLYRVCYPSLSSGAGLCDKMLIYNWSIDRWTPCAYSVEYLFRAKTETGITLEDLDALYPSGIDAMTISFDSSIFNSTPQEALAAFDSAHKLGLFDGANLAATIDSVKAQIIPKSKAKIKTIRAHCDGGTAAEHKIKLVIHDDKLNDAERLTAQVTQRDTGRFPFATQRTKGRIHMARHDIAAGADWTHFQGWDFEATPAGQR